MVPQSREQRQEGKPENREIIPVDSLKEPDRGTFETVPADGMEHGVALKGQHGIEFGEREGAEGERCGFNGGPERGPGFYERHSGMKVMGAPPEAQQLLARFGERGGLVEQRALKFEGLVGPDHDIGRIGGRKGLCFRKGEKTRSLAARRRFPQALKLQRTLVNFRWTGLESEPGP